MTTADICKCQSAYTIADFVQGTLSEPWAPFVPCVMEPESSVVCRCACAALAGRSQRV